MKQIKKKRRTLKPLPIILTLGIIILLIFSLLFIFTKCKGENVTPIEKTPIEENREQTEKTPPDEPLIPEVPDEPSETRLTFLAFGDNLIHSSIIEDAERIAKEAGNGEKYDFDPMYENFRDIVGSSDIAFINQETPIAGPDFPAAGYPNFNTPTELGDTLVELGFNVINTATNHMLDCRGKGLLYHADYWESKAELNVMQIGSYKNREDYEKIRIFEKDGVKIAFLAYTYSTNGMTPGANYSDIYIPYIDNDEIVKKVKEAKELADLVFVSMHWGYEDSFDPSYEQRESAQALVDAGADLIIGTHPHVIQEMKWKENDEGHKTLIVYSLGNFISTMYYPWNMFGGYLSLDIVKDETGARIENPLFNPTMCHYSLKRRELKMYTLEQYSQELYNLHGTTLKNATYSYDRIVNTVKKYIPEEFLTDYYKNYGNEE